MLILDGLNGTDWIGIERQSWLWTDLNGLKRRKLVLELLEWIIMVLLLSLLFSRDHLRDRAKEAVGHWHHRGRDNGRKKRECRRPFNRVYIYSI
jgi:hypothetical protein